MAISLNQFVTNNIGKILSNPDGSVPGQCVSLVQQYLYQCLDIPFTPRGHAKNWVNLPASIATKQTGTPKAGDIVIFPTRGVVDGVTYGHIGVAVSSTELFEQNVAPNYVAEKRLFSNISGERVIMRPVKALVEDLPPNATGVYLYATKQSFRVRNNPINGATYHTVSVGDRAAITGFLGMYSDGYQWLRVNSRGIDGYAQLDTYNCYTLNGYISSRWLVATKQSFRVRNAVVSGATQHIVPVGARAQIIEFLPIQSDGYQWVKVIYAGTQGYSQIDTKNCYTVA